MNFIDIVFINLYLNALLLPSKHSGFLLLETWLSITWYMFQDSMWPREQDGCALCRKPSSREAHLTVHWLNSTWQSENPENGRRRRRPHLCPRLRSRGFTSSCWVHWECELHREVQNWAAASSEDVVHFALKFGILCVTPKLGHCVKILWNF